jgi:hypothetical protein
MHLDVKENNILINDSKLPVIIDFGLSQDVAELEKIENGSDETSLSIDELIESYFNNDVFFTFASDYDPWCIDLCILTYMYNKIKKEDTSWKNETINQTDIDFIMKDFFYKEGRDNNNIIKKILEKYKKNYKEYFEVWVGKSWKELFGDLMKYKYTWDNYALIVIYINILSNLNITKIGLLDEYNRILETYMSLTPDKRYTYEETIEKIKAIFENVDKSKMEQSTKKINSLKSISQDIRGNILNNKKDNLVKEAKMYEKKNKK